MPDIAYPRIYYSFNYIISCILRTDTLFFIIKFTFILHIYNFIWIKIHIFYIYIRYSINVVYINEFILLLYYSRYIIKEIFYYYMIQLLNTFLLLLHTGQHSSNEWCRNHRVSKELFTKDIFFNYASRIYAPNVTILSFYLLYTRKIISLTIKEYYIEFQINNAISWR